MTGTRATSPVTKHRGAELVARSPGRYDVRVNNVDTCAAAVHVMFAVS
uniref:Uncharacterized protein n=1 Tax=Ralstonia pickettii (strain 12J) TaxID=402626 RepID=B2U6X4_RALPJ